MYLLQNDGKLLVQYSPESTVHELTKLFFAEEETSLSFGGPLHRQVALLSVMPFVLVQSGADRQIQVSMEEHTTVVPSVLNLFNLFK